MRSLGVLIGAGVLVGGALLAGWVLSQPAAVAPAHRLATPFAAPGADLTLLVVGTSLTANSAWPEALQRHLAACTGWPVALQRAARAGANSDWGVQRVADISPELKTTQALLVLIEFSINDADLRDGVSVAQGRANLLAMIAALRRANPDARIVLMTMSPAFGLRGWLRPFLTHHEAMLREIAVSARTGLLDLAPVWRAALSGASDRWQLMPDGLHPTEAAIRAVALPVLTEELGRLFGRDCGA